MENVLRRRELRVPADSRAPGPAANLGSRRLGHRQEDARGSGWASPLRAEVRPVAARVSSRKNASRSVLIWSLWVEHIP